MKTKSRLKQDKLQIYRFSFCIKGISFNKQPGKCGSDSNTTDLVSPGKRYNLGVSNNNNNKKTTFEEASMESREAQNVVLVNSCNSFHLCFCIACSANWFWRNKQPNDHATNNTTDVVSP